MEITVLAVGAYLAAAVLAAKYLLILPQRQDLPVLLSAFVFIFLLFWPVWAPIVAFHRIRARRAEPAYLAKLEELEGLIAQDKALRMQIDELLEQLAVSRNDSQISELLADLAAKTRTRQDTHRRSAEAGEEARSILVGNLQWSRLGLPVIPRIDFREESQPRDSGGVSRIRLYLSSNSEEGDDWNLASASRSLREHLYGLARPDSDGTPALFPSLHKYKLESPARSRSWETVITSSFRKSLRRANDDIEERAMAAIEELLVNPLRPRGNTIRRLTGAHKGLWRYRIGDFRLIYQPLVEQGELRLISLTHRSQAY